MRTHTSTKMLGAVIATVAAAALAVPTAFAAGPGGGPNVTVYGANGILRHSFFAYDADFGGGVFVAVGDVNNDGCGEVVTGAGAGGGPNVSLFDVRAGALLDSAQYEALIQA